MNEILGIIVVIIVTIIGLSLLASLIGVFFKIGIIIVAAAIVYRLYLNYKINKK